MTMRNIKLPVSLLVLLSFAVTAQSPKPENDAARNWWAHISYLADDKLQGRDTGSEGHRQAADYIAATFRSAGLQPGGTKGYLQPVSFRARHIVEEKSSLALVRNGKAEPIVLGDEATISMRGENAPRTEAPLVFVGYGLSVPEMKYDDLAGLDLRGKVIVLLTGGPASIPGPLRAHYQSARNEALQRAGVIGVISIQNPKGQDIPWERSKLARFMPSLSLVETAASGQQLSVTVNPAHAEKFFAGSGHTWQEILALANAEKPLPKFALPTSIRADVVGILPGTDPQLKNEYVVLSAHLDHIGVGQPINGDKIYNGAMDNASGIATLLETALALQKKQARLRRSVVFVAVTAEEKGLLGSRYFASHPTVPARAIVANINTDMFLPLYPLRSLIVQGLEESNLADDVRQVGAALGLQVLSDPEPERNAFTRSDQYSFIQQGIPAVSLKVGFVKDSPEHAILKRWRTERYHAPADDLSQPVDLQAAVEFNRAYLAIVEAIANRAERPRWNADSFFRRFAR